MTTALSGVANDPNNLTQNLGQLSLNEPKYASENTLQRFLSKRLVVGHVGSFFCSTLAEYATFCRVSKAFASDFLHIESARSRIFSQQNQVLVELAYNRLQQLEQDKEYRGSILSDYHLRKTNSEDEVPFDLLYKDKKCRRELLQLSFKLAVGECALGLPKLFEKAVKAALNWLCKYYTCKRIVKLYIPRKAITSWKFTHDFQSPVTEASIKRTFSVFPNIKRVELSIYHLQQFEPKALGALRAFSLKEFVFRTGEYLTLPQLQLIVKMTTLQKLTLQAPSGHGEHLSELCALRNLTALDLGETWLENTHLQFLTLPEFPKLRELSVFSTCISSNGFRYLKNIQTLTALSFSCPNNFYPKDPIRDEALLFLKEHKLRKLNLSGCQYIRGTFLSQFRHINLLEELNLEGTGANDTAVLSLTKASSLHTLNLRKCYAVSKDAKKLLTQQIATTYY